MNWLIWYFVGGLLLTDICVVIIYFQLQKLKLMVAKIHKR